MKPSKNYEKLVKHFESCLTPTGDGHFKAYKCPAGVWTIGWGSTFNYKANRNVDQYDLIDQATADDWFSRETAEKYKGISEMLPAILNQDQVDACTSFAYNVGLGAFAESTFRKRINSGENKQTVCEEEFPKWHHGNGQDLEGLKRRRAAEVALFCGNYSEVKKQTQGEVICEEYPEIMPVPLEVGWFEPRLIIDDIGQWEVGIVARGAGSDTAIAVAKIPVQMNMVKKFTSQYPNAKSFALPPREKAWPGVAAPAPKPVPEKDEYLKIQRTGTTENGLEKLLLTLEGTNLNWYVNSGARGCQVFLKGGTGELPGTLYPAPQGEYSVEDIEWAGGKDNYSATHGPGLGPVFVPFNPKFSTKRGSFGLHLDSNRSTSPGSAGCIVFSTLDELKSFVAALREYDPRRLQVAWGL